MAYLLNADFIIDALEGRRNTGRIVEYLQSADAGIALFTLAEVYEAGFNTANPEAFIENVRRFRRPYRAVAPDERVMVRFAEIRAYLRRRGEMISDFDTLLAATALEYDLTVLTFNLRHRGRVPDLKVYTPA